MPLRAPPAPPLRQPSRRRCELARLPTQRPRRRRPSTRLDCGGSGGDDLLGSVTSRNTSLDVSTGLDLDLVEDRLECVASVLRSLAVARCHERGCRVGDRSEPVERCTSLGASEVVDGCEVALNERRDVLAGGQRGGVLLSQEIARVSTGDAGEEQDSRSGSRDESEREHGGRSFRGQSVGEDDSEQSEGENQRAEPAVSRSRASKRLVDCDVAVHVVGSPPLSDLLFGC